MKRLPSYPGVKKTIVAPESNPRRSSWPSAPGAVMSDCGILEMYEWS